MILYVLFYELVDDSIGVGMLYYVRPVGHKDKLLLTLCNLSVIFSFVINKEGVK